MSIFKKIEMYKCNKNAWTYAWNLFENSYEETDENEYFSFLFIECMMHTWNVFL